MIFLSLVEQAAEKTHHQAIRVLQQYYYKKVKSPKDKALMREKQSANYMKISSNNYNLILVYIGDVG